MDCKKIGNLIYELRKSKNMTQKQIANLMNISDKTISKCNMYLEEKIRQNTYKLLFSTIY